MSVPQVPVPLQSAMPVQAAGGPPPDPGGRFGGAAARWNERGFGFIKPDNGDEDVFCHFSCISDGDCLKDGDRVEYSREYDERKGKWRATEVTGGSTNPAPGGRRERSPPRGGPTGPPTGGKVRGTAARWNERGFGFIKPADGGEDVFCHFSNITDGEILREGAIVDYLPEFDDRKGKYRASQVTGGSPKEEPQGYGGGGGGGYGAPAGGGYGGGGGYPQPGAYGGGGGYGGPPQGGGYGGPPQGGGYGAPPQGGGYGAPPQGGGYGAPPQGGGYGGGGGY